MFTALMNFVGFAMSHLVLGASINTCACVSSPLLIAQLHLKNIERLAPANNVNSFEILCSPWSNRGRFHWSSRLRCRNCCAANGTGCAYHPCWALFRRRRAQTWRDCRFEPNTQVDLCKLLPKPRAFGSRRACIGRTAGEPDAQEEPGAAYDSGQQSIRRRTETISNLNSF